MGSCLTVRTEHRQCLLFVDARRYRAPKTLSYSILMENQQDTLLLQSFLTIRGLWRDIAHLIQYYDNCRWAMEALKLWGCINFTKHGQWPSICPSIPAKFTASEVSDIVLWLKGMRLLKVGVPTIFLQKGIWEHLKAVTGLLSSIFPIPKAAFEKHWKYVLGDCISTVYTWCEGSQVMGEEHYRLHDLDKCLDNKETLLCGGVAA